MFPALFWYDTNHYSCMLGPLLGSTYHQLSNEMCRPGDHWSYIYNRWVGSLRFTCGSGNRWFHFRMPCPQMGSVVAPISMDAVVRAVAAINKKLRFISAPTACACSSFLGGPQVSCQIWPGWGSPNVPQIHYVSGLFDIVYWLKVLNLTCWLYLVWLNKFLSDCWPPECFLPGPVFCLLLWVSSGCARPITGQVTSIASPLVGWAHSELTLIKRENGPWTFL